MSWQIRVSSHAEKYYLRLDKRRRERIRKELTDLADFADPAEHPQVKPLAGELRGFYRLRVGGYRAIFALLPEEHVIAVVNLAPRGGAYK